MRSRSGPLDRPGRVLAEFGSPRAAPATTGSWRQPRFVAAPRAGARGTRGALRTRRGTRSGWLPPLLAVLVLLGAWETAAQRELLADALGSSRSWSPRPPRSPTRSGMTVICLPTMAGSPSQEVLAGFAVSLILASAWRSVCTSRRSRGAVYPLVVASQTIPIIVLAPILVVWFGFGIWPKLVIIALICFFPIAVNTLDGLALSTPSRSS